MLTAEIDLGAIKDNALYIKKRVKTEVYAVVKADAYGHGAVRVAKHIENVVDGFAVATDFEALELTGANIKKPILILETELSGIKLPKNVIASVATPEQIRAVKNVANGVHIAVNSGMNRLGCKPSEIIELLKVADGYGVSVVGAFTHFYDEHNSESCAEQFDEFLSGVLSLRNRIRRLHCCASNCLILPEVYRLDVVRPGLALYGYGYDGVKPAMKIYSHIVQINDVNVGEHVGYGNYTADKPMRIATVRLGYGDGFWRRNGHKLLVNGKYCRLVGLVCMDACMIDVSEVDCKPGDKAYVLANGEQMNDICITHNTISHEVLTMISRRVKRNYVNE